MNNAEIFMKKAETTQCLVRNYTRKTAQFELFSMVMTPC